MVATITMGAKTTYMTLKLLAHVTKSRHITVRALKAHCFHRREENLTTFGLISQQSAPVGCTREEPSSCSTD